jgi:translation initiation factor 2 beta subunit (eIF-2beta)/eIF-5
MTSYNPDRLDRVEALLERFVETSVADDRQADRQASNGRMARLEQAIECDRQASNERMTRIEQAIKENTAAIKDLKSTVETLADEAKAGRVVMHEMIDQLVTLRNSNIQQQGNGHGDQPEDDF